MENETDLLGLTADIIAAFVSNNKVTPEALPELIASTYAALNNVGQPVAEPEPELNLPTGWPTLFRAA